MSKRSTLRNRILDVEELRHLLDLTEHQVRALIPNNDDAEDFPYDLLNYARRPRRRAALSADREAL